MIYFLEQLLTLLSLTFIGNGFGYLFYYLILNQWNKSFRGLKYEKKLYVMKNLTKSSFLTFLTLYTTPNLYQIYQTGIWDNELITFMGHIYVSTDIAGLFFVPNLPQATKIHHTVVFFFGMANILVDYNQPGIHRALITLTYFSIIPYIVNTLLGSRYLGFPLVNRWLAIFASILYGICITLNCIIQHVYIFYLSDDWWVMRLTYLILYHLIFWDDRNLMKWLFKVAMNPYKKNKL